MIRRSSGRLPQLRRVDEDEGSPREQQDPGADPHSLDAGLGSQINDNLSLEMTGGAGLNEAAADFFLNFLVAVAF